MTEPDFTPAAVTAAITIGPDPAGDRDRGGGFWRSEMSGKLPNVITYQTNTGYWYADYANPFLRALRFHVKVGHTPEQAHDRFIDAYKKRRGPRTP